MTDRHAADGRFAGRAPAQRFCYFCRADISARRRDAWACAEHSGPLSWHRRQTLERQRAVLVKRPRCMICDTPLDPKRKGATCSRECAIKRWNWFRRA